MPRVSEMPRPGPLTGLELIPGLQGAGPAGNVGMPLLLTGAPFGGAVPVLRAPMTADMAATADADPGAGNIRWNHASPGSATVLYISDDDAAAADLATPLAGLSVGGFVYVQGGAAYGDDPSARDNLQKWQVASITAATGYTKVGVTLAASAGAFTDADVLELTMQQPLPGAGTNRNIVDDVTSVSGTTTVDASLGDYFRVALSENTTLAVVGAPPACSLMIRITQDSTARTVAWPASFKWAGGSAGAVSAGSGAVDVLAITTFDNGTTWDATLAKAFA
ncbi:MAG: hypothetical protein IAE85_03840 [Anaerolinea sp.]|nr:hypothetical protein [Anaerolinea sp.]